MISFQHITANLFNIPGWSSPRKIVILESDDWGSIRMPSLKAFETLKAAGLDLESGDAARYNQNDTLESSSDLEALYSAVSKFKGADGKSPVFTFVSIVGNPDFDRIRESGFSNYYWEPFTRTMERYGRTGVMDLLQQGISEKLVDVQFHGREHLNVRCWMRALQQGDAQAMKAFEQGCWGFNNINKFGVSFQACFDLEHYEDIVHQHAYLKEGLDAFQQLYGYRASFFVPPNGPYNNELSATAAAGGIKYLSLSKKHYDVLGEGKKKMQFNWLGKKNRYGQSIMTRNAVFEPGMNENECVENCLRQLEVSFRWNKPAVISTHRVNYTGSLVEANRARGLRKLEELLTKILKQWPDVHFMSSSELGDLITGKDK